MNAALELVRAGPPAGALLLVGTGRPGARNATDRPVPHVVERVVRNFVVTDVTPDIGFCPLGKRLNLPDAVPLGALDLPRAGPRRGLLAPNSGHPRGVRAQHLDQRLDLADVAAPVGVRLPEVRPLVLVLLGNRE